MGGNHSSQSASQSTTVAATIMQLTAQSCISEASGGNSLTVTGADNTVDGVTGTVSLSVDSSCPTLTAQSSQFEAAVRSATAQALSESGVAGTEWLDAGGESQSSSISSDVSTRFTQSTVKLCVNSLRGANVVSVSGTGQTVRNVKFATTLGLLSDCVLGNSQTSGVVASITNTSNQHASHVSANPLAFLTDAFSAAARDGLVLVAVLVLAALGAGGAYLVLRRVGARRASAPPAA